MDKGLRDGMGSNSSLLDKVKGYCIRWICAKLLPIFPIMAGPEFSLNYLIVYIIII